MNGTCEFSECYLLVSVALCGVKHRWGERQHAEKFEEIKEIAMYFFLVFEKTCNERG